MKVSELWLRTLINPPLSTAALSEQLINAGIEVDSIDLVGDKTPETVFTLKIPPSRGDCLSIEGIARELSLLNAMPYQAVAMASTRVAPTHTETFKIRIDTPELCPRYMGCVVKHIKNKTATPDWIKDRLVLGGYRTVSPVVDILNYVMLELGQPMHAFDVAKLEFELVIRKSMAGERVTLLDDREIVLEPGTLVIADKSQIQALAGIMGGLYSSVTDNTTDVLIECAYFDPVAVRLAAKRYGMKTDGSYRFERGVDPMLQQRALERTLQLLAEITGGSVGPIFETKSEATLPKQKPILLRTDRIKRILGIAFPAAEIEAILKQGGFQVETKGVEGFEVIAPSYRQDISLEVDLIEEIARVHGLHRLPSVSLTGALDYASLTKTKTPVQPLKTVLVDRGYSEVITYSFGDEKVFEVFESAEQPAQKPLVLQNPISAEMAVMRNSLLPGLVETLALNQRRQNMRARLFEMGVCFFESNGKTVEKSLLSGIVAGSVTPEQWGEPARSHDFFDIKADVEALLACVQVGKEKLIFEKTEHHALHPGQTARILRDGKSIGFVGALHPRLVKSFGLEGTVFAFELEVAGLEQDAVPLFLPLSKFPAIRRDIAILVDRSISAADLKASIEKSAGEFLQGVSLFDVYQGKGIPLDKKSMALGLILQHPSRTLVEGEGNDIVKTVVAMLTKQFGAVLRD